MSDLRLVRGWLQVQVRRGTWAAPMVLGKAYDIRRMTAEQQAARAALQSLGLQVPVLARYRCARVSRGTSLPSRMQSCELLKHTVTHSA